MNLFLDFDGTLIESKPRLYNLFQYLVPTSTLTFDTYWQLKMKGQGHETILKKYFQYTESAVESFKQAWLQDIEKAAWIKFDQPFEGVTEKLEQLKKRYQLNLITSRQLENVVHDQLNSFGWKNLFNKVLVTHQSIEKQDLILQYIEVTPNDWFVGDTGKDIEAGKALGIGTVGVLSGFRNKVMLEKYYPNILLKSIVEFTCE